MEGPTEDQAAESGLATTTSPGTMETDILSNQDVAPAAAAAPVVASVVASVVAAAGTAPIPAPAAGCRPLLHAAAQTESSSVHAGGVAAPVAQTADAVSAVPAASAVAGPAAVAVGRKTGGTWRQADGPEPPRLRADEGAGSDGAGAGAAALATAHGPIIGDASGCVRGRGRLKVGRGLRATAIVLAAVCLAIDVCVGACRICYFDTTHLSRRSPLQEDLTLFSCCFTCRVRWADPVARALFAAKAAALHIFATLLCRRRCFLSTQMPLMWDSSIFFNTSHAFTQAHTRGDDRVSPICYPFTYYSMLYFPIGVRGGFGCRAIVSQKPS